MKGVLIASIFILIDDEGTLDFTATDRIVKPFTLIATNKSIEQIEMAFIFLFNGIFYGIQRDTKRTTTKSFSQKMSWFFARNGRRRSRLFFFHRVFWYAHFEQTLFYNGLTSGSPKIIISSSLLADRLQPLSTRIVRKKDTKGHIMDARP